MEELTEDNERVSEELAIVGSDTQRWEAIEVMSCEELNEHTDRDHKVMSFVAFYESIGGQRSDTESTSEPHIQHMNTTSGVESEDNVSQHLSHSEESIWSSDCERNITEDFNAFNETMDSMSGDTHRENQLTVVSTNARDEDIEDNHTTSDNTLLTLEEHESDSNNGSIDSDDREVDAEDSDYCLDAIDGQSGGFKCNYKDCNEVFAESNAYRRHRLTHSVDKSLECAANDCDNQFRYPLRNRMNGHKVVDHYPCAQSGCGQVFRTADDLKRHIRSHTHRPTNAGQSSGVSPPPDERPNDSRYKCHFKGCEKVLTTLRYLYRHRLTHTGEKAFKCPVKACDFRTHWRYDLMAHAKRHNSGREPIECPVNECHYRCERRRQLVYHMNGGHKGLDYYQCPHNDCHQLFLISDALKRHINRCAHRPTAGHSSNSSRRPKDKPYKCHFIGCGKAFKRSDGLRRHRLIHSADKQYKCPIDGCDYRCHWFHLLTLHSKRHTRVRAQDRRLVGQQSGDHVFKCHFIGCGKAFKRSDGLRSHRLIHSSDKPYKCSFDGCDYRCRQRQRLSDHNNRHLGVRPYICSVDECRKAFFSKNNLNEHRLVHSDARPHPCPHPRCTQRFKTMARLRNHRIVAHQ